MARDDSNHEEENLKRWYTKPSRLNNNSSGEGLVRRTSNSSTFSPWKNNTKKHTPSTSKFKEVDPKLGKKVATKKVQPKPNSSRNRDIKCFKGQGRGHIASECPN
ncbi:UNVERIFIED_CONTAM: hypothetical protein Slati_2929200 [Sesamum latifolium]|uniref:CCHC-type domain-containing protein n=1 Tax=Sesamum latifolium TaxID=2727402 RepID=A0AAW2VF02_9LAMI